MKNAPAAVDVATFKEKKDRGRERYCLPVQLS